MKKVKVNTLYTYILYFILGVVAIFFGLLPFILPSNGEIFWRIIFVILMLLFSVSMIYYGGFLNQTVIIEDNGLLLKNLYGIMIILNQEDVEKVKIERLPTYYSWVTTIYKDWICIYSKANYKKFTKGSSNSKKNKNIQVIYTESNYQKILEFMNQK